MKIFEGKVIATKMERTAVVEVFRMTPHPLYKKLVKLSKKYKVDNLGFENVTVGSTVKITETKPISKDKYFKILEIITLREEENVVNSEAELRNVSKKAETDALKSTKSTENNKASKPKKVKTVKKETKK